MLLETFGFRSFDRTVPLGQWVHSAFTINLQANAFGTSGPSTPSNASASASGRLQILGVSEQVRRGSPHRSHLHCVGGRLLVVGGAEGVRQAGGPRGPPAASNPTLPSDTESRPEAGRIKSTHATVAAISYRCVARPEALARAP